MQKNTISATVMNRNLSDILNKVYYQGKSFEIRRGKEIIAKIAPFGLPTLKVEDLNEFFDSIPKLEKGDDKLFEKEIMHFRKQLKIDGDQWD